MSRFFLVTSTDGAERIVEADTRAKVRAHLLAPLTIEPAKQSDIARVVRAGGAIELATDVGHELEAAADLSAGGTA